MSHDRGCYCGKERWDYPECKDPTCWKQPRVISTKEVVSLKDIEQLQQETKMKSSKEIADMQAEINELQKQVAKIIETIEKMNEPAVDTDAIRANMALLSDKITDKTSSAAASVMRFKDRFTGK